MQTSVKVTLPEMGESVTEGSIVEWRRKIGDFVAEGDPLVDVTTDKVDVEVPATASGVITRIFADEGATVKVGSDLVEIDTTKALGNGAAARAKPKAQVATPAPPAPPPAAPTGARTAEAVATPQAQRIAQRRDLEIARVRGSGPNGLILRQDVLDQVESAKRAAAPPQPPLPSHAQVTPLKGPAAALAGYMEQSLSVPTATSFRTVSVDALDARRREINASLRAAGRSEKVSFTHVIAFALVRAAHELPFMTHSFRRDEQGRPQRVEAGIHLGLAVDTERKDGTRFLIVPVIKNADALDFVRFHAAYDDLVARARENKLAADDVAGATFTLTNPGGIGTVASVPRLMAGQGSIIATGAIGFPAGLAGASEQSLRSLGVAKVMQMTSTYDHRVIAGAQSGEYLRRVDELLQGRAEFYESIFSALALAPPIPREAQTVALEPSREKGPSEEMLRAVAAGMAIVAAYRTHGHLAAHLDPLGSEPSGDPSLDPKTYGLTPALQSAVPAAVLEVKVPGNTLAEVIPELRATYSSTIAFEIEHISSTEQRRWLRDYVESGKHRIAFSPERRREILRRLTRVESFERYLRKTFLGQKTFSLEGLDALVPMLEETLELLAADGVEHAVIGMAHRGRLNTIAHILNLPYDEILAEFEAANERSGVGDADVTGDVKYHHGEHGTYRTSGAAIEVTLANNPSHLEAVDAVVEGASRALQTDRSVPLASHDLRKAVPILIHGDAAFTGQGVVSEVLNLQALPGYATGGTLHVIANNQVGFTTETQDGRSTRYASDLAKGFDLPIVHVNADDLDACIAAVHLAVAFRRTFERDVLIDLIGYRRVGHNETDEPAYTQPRMYEAIKSHPTARELYANKLAAQSILTAEEANELATEATAALQEAHRRVKSTGASLAGILAELAGASPPAAPALRAPDTAQLLAWNDALVAVPTGFALNKKLQTQFERRRGVVRERRLVDWGTAEALAFASLVCAGIPVRLTGQDTERGTFSHRHAVWHDVATGARYVPLHHLDGARASFEIHNSPLSEYACMGFEYGYSAVAQDALVLWEAQYGDFFNGAQIVVDQFISAGQAKWGQQSRLTLLLPHGYEGGGPEHSSARLERFLQLSAENNLRVAYPSTTENYFHVLRLQASDGAPAPLVLMTPKSLLRHEASYGTIDELARGAFRSVIDDPAVKDKKKIERLILCTGKIYYDLTESEQYKKTRKTAIVRVEMLAPLPHEELRAVIDSYSGVKTLLWVQEEPKNMGARAHVRRRLLERLDKSLDIAYVGRPYRASPSEGYAGQHAVEQERIIAAALTE
ncbi:MAG TPA: multifunctional oxoglutarate decarboxylase/oxoglutarate dehydrogenase thiamine pyrophosphate-binding subunit/dihydrolipoyllysine-residue succinyltransferase subunit [Candidatus Dormibacteraeota bacterium]|nr:multifunctional oxoglutarate decarboxylase/oxoglutarate dehydrogenase thiamine pyrophosphate-binding subunit/dihydrolipoyllysine-residue succinyltransferase subunit [Candidatus Dormibacteraeota bacterium]